MSTLLIVVAIVATGLLWLCAAWLDQKHSWKLIDWFSGNTNSPFASQKQEPTQTLHDKNLQIAELTQRVKVLEKIVTEPAYELNQKINQL